MMSSTLKSQKYAINKTLSVGLWTEDIKLKLMHVIEILHQQLNSRYNNIYRPATSI